MTTHANITWLATHGDQRDLMHYALHLALARLRWRVQSESRKRAEYQAILERVESMREHLMRRGYILFPRDRPRNPAARAHADDKLPPHNALLGKLRTVK